MAVTSLTGLPLIISAFSGLKAMMVAQIFGKRPVYLVSSLLMLVSAAWNMHIGNSYLSFMASRIFQGIGWGAFESLVVGSLEDMYFVGEHRSSNAMYVAVLG
jgi:MFS family permease